MSQLTVVNGQWVNLEKPGGQVFFVGGGTVAYKGAGPSDGNLGTSPAKPLSTLSGAQTACTSGRGDTVVVLPGTVTLTAIFTLSKDDVTLTGMVDSSAIKPSVIASTLASSTDVIDVTGANCVIENLHFSASGAANTARINVGAAGATIRNNTFACGVNDLETITIPAAGLHTSILGNRFNISANGPDAAIEIEAAGAHFITIADNVFHGMNATNQWDVGAINSGVAHLSCLVTRNTNTFGAAIIFSAAATGMISHNNMGYGTLVAMLDPGSCMCAENYEADAIDQTARVFPVTAAS